MLSSSRMKLSPLIHMDMSLKLPIRRVGASTSTKLNLLSHRTKPYSKFPSKNATRRSPATYLNRPRAGSDDQTVVDPQTEEVEEKEEELVEEYSGPGASLLSSMKEAAKDNNVSAESLEGWSGEIQEHFKDLETEVDVWKKKNENTVVELEEAKTQFLRLRADFDNFRKRADSERDQLRKNTKADVLGALLPLIDNFELAKEQTQPNTESEEAIFSSFMGLYRQMTDLFSEMGLETIECDQKPFDPEFHDAILREPNEELPDGTVTQELRKGFTVSGKLLRPAMVKVSYSEEVLQDIELPVDSENERVADSTLEIESEDDEESQ